MGWLKFVVICLFIAVIAVIAVVVFTGYYLDHMHEQETIDQACFSWGSLEPLNPTPELCKYVFTTVVQPDNLDMQGHFKSVRECCSARGIDYSHAGKYQPRIVVVSGEGAGTDITCNYYPELTECQQEK